MMRQVVLALVLSSCIAPVDQEPGQGPNLVVEGPKETPEYPGSRLPDPDLCAPIVRYGIEIPVECYWGPPRHDDVEVSNPWDKQTEYEQSQQE